MSDQTALTIAPNLELDPDYVGGGTFAVLAKRGAGKTYTGRVMAEEMWRANVPFVVLDPMGAWWGLRSDADGTGPGIPVPIFGGEHGDAPLERSGGAVMADLVVDESLSMILDLKGFGSRAAERQFALDFLERLYRRNRQLVHLFIDEADLFAPQRPAPGDQRLLGAAENVVRRGRNVGLGCTFFSQRPAVLNKDVLTQVDGLVAMRVTGLNDRAAIDEWVKGHADQDAAAKVKGTLAGLGNGESWWWIPEQDILQRVQVRRADTFDSSPTRKRGSTRREPKSIADIDLGAIQERMAATIERAKAEDPKELRRQIRDLKAELAKKPVTPDPVEIVREVPVLTDDDKAALQLLVSTIERLVPHREHVDRAIAQAQSLSDRVGQLLAAAPSAPAPVRSAAPLQNDRSQAPPPAARTLRAAPAGEPGVGSPPPAQRRILNALAFLEGIGIAGPTKTQLALFAQTSPKSSGYQNNLGSLRTAGLIAYPQPGTAALTEEGRAIADEQHPVRSDEDLHTYVRSLVGPARSRVLDVLIEVYPAALSKAELADRAGTSLTSSGYQNNLGNLRSLGLIDYPAPGQVTALPVLFLAG